ncbi:MAG TPA: hypothetical protein VED40_10525 [Azospirillaceae bacterium]|nr:hypothetical protein [Azospirillaceae bacterium]
MSTLDLMLADRTARRTYLATLRPVAHVAGHIAVEAAAGRLTTATPGLFDGLEPGDRLRLTGNGAAFWLSVVTVAGGGTVLAFAAPDPAPAEMAAAARVLKGAVLRTLATRSYTTDPQETPPNRLYRARLAAGTRGERSLFDGGRLRSGSVAGRATLVLDDLDRRLSPWRGWAWAGRPALVEVGAVKPYARADFGLVLDHVVVAAGWTDDTLTIETADRQALIDRAPWSRPYQGTGGFQGEPAARGARAPLCFGWVEHCRPRKVGKSGGLEIWQFHDGPVAAHDPSWHRVTARGTVLTYTAGTPGAGQWTLDAARGCILTGGAVDEPLTARVKGCAAGSFAETAGQIVRRLATRALLDGDVAFDALTVGTGARTLTLPGLPLAAGERVLVAAMAEQSAWMSGLVTAQDPATGATQVTVDEAAGAGSFNEWTVNRLGLTAVDAASFTALDTAWPHPMGLYLANEGEGADGLLSAFDRIMLSADGWHDQGRGGVLRVGRLGTGTPKRAIRGGRLEELREIPLQPAPYRITVGFRPNFAPLADNDLVEAVRAEVVSFGEFESTTGWTLGTGWTIAGGRATAAAGTASSLSRTITPAVADRYTLRLVVSSLTAGALTVTVNGTAVGAAITAAGTVERAVDLAAIGQTLSLDKSADFAGTVELVSLRSSRHAELTGACLLTDPALLPDIRAVAGRESRPLTVVSLLRDKTHAEALRDRLRDWHAAGPRAWQLVQNAAGLTDELGDTVTLSDATPGLVGGRALQIVQIDDDYIDETVSCVGIG